VSILPVTETCARCGAQLVTIAHTAVCAACSFEAGIGEELAGAARIGSYELVDPPLDRGGTGLVFIAHNQLSEGLVALKIARPELLESADMIAAFRNGLRIQQALRELPGIVSTYELGTSDDGRPYSVMPLLGGGTLAAPDNRARYSDPSRAIELVIDLARAVHSAHQRGVLHCDLKPQNVLFDDAGAPFVSDFGFARLLESAPFTRGASLHGGTPGWMSPEQARGDALTTATDVFSLGVLLYWLLSYELPFGDGDDFEQRVQHEPHRPLAASYRGRFRWELEQICDRALHKAPEQRYPSAFALAQDLERAIQGKPIEAELRRPMRRSWKWMLRHKLATAAALELCVLVACLPLIPLSVVGEVKGTIRAQLAFAAQTQAGAVIGELRALAERLEQLAREPEIAALIEHADPYAPPRALTERGFDGLSVFSATGTLRARWPRPWTRHPSLDFPFRDYFQGQLAIAKRAAHEVYVARSFYSTGDEEPMLGMSTPLYEGQRPIGALIGRTRARATFGAMHMSCGERGSCTTALLGPRDRDSAAQAMPDAIYMLAAPGLGEGQALMLDAARAKQICARLPCAPAGAHQLDAPSTIEPLVLEDYEDPITRVRSMAALMPVGGTGLIVVVSTPDNALAAISERMTDRIKQLLWLQVALGCGLLIAAAATPLFARPPKRWV